MAEPRYPNLERYLNLALALTIVLTGVIVLAALVSFWEGEDGVLAGMMLLFFSPIFYFASMASIDLCRLLMDIEANTRNR